MAIRTHQLYAAAIQSVGMTEMQKLFKRSPTQIYRWARDPDFAEDCERNPLDRMRALLRQLCAAGRVEVAEGAVKLLADAVSDNKGGSL
jgi:hypothetical protein